ncbi:MAG: serine/threonine-protein kinase [Candidatus Xenobia bacterium]
MLRRDEMLDSRYRVRDLLAEGGMSFVYEVEDQRTGGVLALKVMRELVADRATQAELEAQFVREAELLARLSHPNLPRVTDHFVWNGRRCLVQELVRGRTLEAASEGGPCRETDVLGWTLQLCDALEYLHQADIVYRDIKPSNCIVTDGGQIKLIDFGIARVFAIGKARDTVLMGTPGFAAPEQFGRDQTDARSDIYSLGVLMHVLLTGRDPSATPFIFPDVRELNPLVSDRVRQAVAKALELSPERRFQCIAELRSFLSTGELPLRGTPTFAYPESVAPKLPGYLGMGAVAGMVAVGGLLSLLFQGAWPGALAAAYGPTWVALLVRDYRQRRRMAVTRVRVEEDGLSVSEGRQTRRLRWGDIRRIAFGRDDFSGAEVAEVQTDAEKLRLVLKASEPLGIPALTDAPRLARILHARQQM